MLSLLSLTREATFKEKGKIAPLFELKSTLMMDPETLFLEVLSVTEWIIT